MVDYRTGSHTVFDIKYHLVWVTKYRYSILVGDIGHRVRDLIRQICMTRDMTIIKGHVSPDHVHLLLSCPPNYQREVIPAATAGVFPTSQAILGPASVGTRLLLCHNRYRNGRDGQSLY